VAATKDKPLTKEALGEKLAKRFPDRSAESMMRTVNVQVPARLAKEKGVNVQKGEGGFGLRARIRVVTEFTRAGERHPGPWSL